MKTDHKGLCVDQLCCNTFGEKHRIQNYIDKLHKSLIMIATSSSEDAEQLKQFALHSLEGLE